MPNYSSNFLRLHLDANNNANKGATGTEKMIFLINIKLNCNRFVSDVSKGKSAKSGGKEWMPHEKYIWAPSLRILHHLIRIQISFFISSGGTVVEVQQERSTFMTFEPATVSALRLLASCLPKPAGGRYGNGHYTLAGL